ncbi:MAG TPA: hypothetical protein VEU74_07650 [Gemmatimonadales bacterium]|nr:hypothetical protein [Gemmatimonadales bacterium]
MTLGRLLLAWLLVGVWFLIAPPIGYRVDLFIGRQYFVWAYNRRAVTGRVLEALAATFLGSLWFDSLGAGEWWLVFALVGLLVAYPVRWHVLSAAATERRRELVAGLMDTARYVVAGGILAWILR